MLKPPLFLNSSLLYYLRLLIFLLYLRIRECFGYRVRKVPLLLPFLRDGKLRCYLFLYGKLLYFAFLLLFFSKQKK
jgi:hypothetical protein